MKEKIVTIILASMLAAMLGLLPVMPASAGPAFQILFQDNFESGSTTLTPILGNWAIVPEVSVTNKVYYQSSDQDNSFAATHLGDTDWTNYRFEVKMKILEPTAGMGYGPCYRVGTGQPAPGGGPQPPNYNLSGYNSYQVQISGSPPEIYVWKGYYTSTYIPNVWDKLEGRSMTWDPLNKWLTITVEVISNHHKVSATDGTNIVTFEFNDTSVGPLSGLGPLTFGGIALNACGRAQFDDVKVTNLTPTILFTTYRDGNEEIYLMYANGLNQTRLTSNPTKDTAPALSPDGTKIAFTSWRDGNREIYTMNSDGSNVTRLTNNPAWDMWPAWSPDGSKIAFMSTRDGNGEIYVMNADGNAQTRLTNMPLHDSKPTWSPDGSKIAFMRNHYGNGEIYVMNADGSNVTRLTNNPAEDDWPAWSPDGSKIAFMSTRDGNSEIYVMNADGTGQVNTTNNSASDYAPVWFYLLDGQLKIAFTTNRDGYYPEIYSMFANGSGLFRLTNNAPISDWTRGYYSGPQVTTGDAANITTNSATLKGNLDSLGSAPSAGESINVSFLIGKTSGSYPKEVGVQSMSANGIFSYTLIPELEEGTTYYFRAQAVGHGIDWGVEKSFTTNHRPTITSLTLPQEPVAITTLVNGSASFTDADITNTHTGVWDWGNGSTSAATIVEANGTGTATGSHTYTQAGVYEVKLVLTDSAGASVESVFQYVVVYNPGGGFVTGGGWINSPPGSYKANPALTGKATFGFVAKYQKGANTPTGQTEFQFHVANLNFHSETYDWLVIAGAKAQYKGTGTINNTGEYSFMLTAIDGQLLGGGKSDMFRIKIWNNTGIVYDNQMGKDENGDFATEIGGGSIVIHK